MENSFIITIFGFCGLLIGSLLTQIAHRIPLILIAEWQSNAKSLSHKRGHFTANVNQNALSLFSRPVCPQCSHLLALCSLVPVYSWWKRQGQCQYCQQTICITYPLTELITAFLFMAIASSHQDFVWLIILLSVTSLLITAILIDVAHQLLPNVLTFPLIFSGLFVSLLGFAPLTLWESFSGVIFGYLLLWIPATVFIAIRGIEGLGQGDIKLIAGLGAWIGPSLLPVVVFVASIGALSFVLLTYGYKRSKNKRIAFGPFLAIAGWLALLKDPFMIDLSILLRALL